MIDTLTAVTDFDTFCLQSHEIEKTKRRTKEWTIPRLVESGCASGRILSVGCGSGADIITLREHGYDALGVDLYKPIPEASPWFQLAPADALPFQDAHFDAVLCLEVIEHIPHERRTEAAREMRRVLRKDGIIILATPNRFFPIDEHGSPVRIHSPFRDDTLTAKEIEALFGCKAKTLTWNKYFQFQRFGWAAPALRIVTAPLGWNFIHRSPLNPHLFLELR